MFGRFDRKEDYEKFGNIIMYFHTACYLPFPHICGMINKVEIDFDLFTWDFPH